MEVSESTFCLQLHFDYQASGPLVQDSSPAKPALNVTTTFDVVFSSDRSSDRFTGKPVSQTTGLYYDYQRWYDPSIGRFVSVDPLAGSLSDPQSQNGYVYARNLPTVLVDPTGAVYCYDMVTCYPGYWGDNPPPTQEELDRIQDPRLRQACGDNPSLFCPAGLDDPDLSGTVGGNPGNGGANTAGSENTPSPGITTYDTTTRIPVDTNPTTTEVGLTEPTGATDMTTVRHYTNMAGREGITQSGSIDPGLETGYVYVTEPSQVEGLTTPEQIANRLEISPDKGVTYYEFQYPSDRLVDLGMTSGGAQQFGIREPVILSDVRGIWWWVVG